MPGPSSPKSDKSGRPAAAAVSYRDAGVDIDAGNALVEAIKPLAQRTCRRGAEPDLGGFGGLFDLAKAGFTDPILVAANDGVGTKLKIAIDTGMHDTIGIDLVAMCVNDLIVQGAEPLFFLDYFSCGKLDVAVATRVVAGIAEGCRQAGCALIGGETAEMPGLYGANDYDLAGFAVGAVERGNLLPRTDIAEDDVLIGLPSSGPHANGFSLIRKLIADQGLDVNDSFPFWPGAPESLGEYLLMPTKIYVKPVLAAIRETGAVKAMAHITGGGMTENIPRVLPDDLAAKIDLHDWRARANLDPRARYTFQWMQTTGNVDDEEWLRTFNCGVGMVLVVDKHRVADILSVLGARGESGFELGRITRRHQGRHVIYSGKLDFAE